MAARILVGAVGGHRVVAVNHRDDAGIEGNVAALQSVRVAGTVEVLMVMPDGAGDAAGPAAIDGEDDLLADQHVLLHAFPFLGIEAVRLAQDDVGNADLAQVVKAGAKCQLLQFAGRQANVPEISWGVPCTLR
eukprot:TRINITY_DN2190_c0_g1_i27.p1 TRINITY_DN2190_c0_g1~~TRINITY_DN2190_c0_g1_i27.p1  ORF type:complete len:133 (+),score=15.27 TRINITY_DN2190_c0_g1_i27:408-806(+)